MHSEIKFLIISNIRAIHFKNNFVLVTFQRSSVYISNFTMANTSQYCLGKHKRRDGHQITHNYLAFLINNYQFTLLIYIPLQELFNKQTNTHKPIYR